jgi:hypothetical protein
MQSATVARLMRELVDCLREHLRDPITALFDAIDDTLFELGEHASSGEAQQRYFTSLRECRRKRGQLSETLLSGLGNFKPSDPEATHPLYSQLSLVAPEDLEEHLAITGMAARTAQRFSGPLYTLSQRLGYLLGDAQMDAMRNPLGPLHISEAFRDAASSLDIDLQTRLVVYKLFERQVLGALEPAYSEMNVRLAAAGVLPTLSPRYGHDAARTRAAPAIPRPQPAATNEGERRDATSPATEAANRSREHDLLAALRVMLTRDSQPARGETAAGSPPPEDGNRAAANSVAAIDVLEGALTRMRTRLHADRPLPRPRMLAAQLLAEARYADGGTPPTPQQSATVDIVGRVFDALSRDSAVPEAMQPVMQTLMLPVMRASLHQSGMLAENAHPLRQLLDLIAEQAIGWSPSVDPEQQLLLELRRSVQQIAASERSEDAERTIAHLRGQLELQRRRAELAEQRAVEATAGRERLWHARRQVHLTLSKLMAQAEVPAWVRYLISHPWANCLVLLWLRHGAESPIYGEAVQFAESLVWCANAGADRVEQLRLRALLPVMEIQLRQGLSTVAYQDSEIRQLVGELQQFLRYRMREIPAPAFLEQQPPAANAPGAIAADPGNIEEQPLPQHVDPRLIERIRTLRPGTWFEFGKDDDAGRERARLSWVSPYSGRCMFVNRNGLKIAERRPEQLAAEIEQGLSKIIEDTRLLQRALTSVLAQLRGEGNAQAQSA